MSSGKEAAAGGGEGKKEAVQVAKREKRMKLQKAMECFRKAQKIIRSPNATHKDLEDGIEYLNAAIAMRPTNGRYYFARANCLRSMGEFQRAFFDYSAAMRLDDSHGLYFCNRGICLRKLDRLQEALQDLCRAIDLDAANGSFYFNRGLVLFDMEEYEAAIKDFTSTIEAKRSLFRAHFNRGNCYRKLGRLDQAVADLEQAVSLDPRPASGHNNLGLALCEAGRYEDALKCFDQAVDRQAENPTFLNNRALAFYHLGKLESAIADLDAAIGIAPNDASAYFHRGNAMLAAGKPTEALVDLRKAHGLSRVARGLAAEFDEGNGLPVGHAALDDAHDDYTDSDDDDDDILPRSKLSRGASSRASLRSGGVGGVLRGGAGAAGAGASAAAGRGGKSSKEDEGGDGSEAAGGSTPDIVSARQRHSIGLAYQALRQHDKALHNFMAALVEDPTHVPSKYHSALMQHQLGEYNAGIQLLDQVMDEAGDERRVREARGLSFQAVGNHQKAVQDFTAAIKFDDQRGEPYYCRAVSLLAMGRANSCVKDLGTALDLGWVRPEVFDARATAYLSLHMFEEALTDYTEAVSMGADNPDYLQHRAKCHKLMGRPHDAELDLTRAIHLRGATSSLLYLRGLALYDQDQFDKCVEDFRHALEKEPSFEEIHQIYYQMGLAFANNDNHASAVPAFTEAVAVIERLPRRDVKVWANYVHERAKSLQMLNEFEKALKDFTTVIEVDELNAHAYFRRGFVFKSLKQFEQAADDFETAKRLDPMNPHLVVNYSQIHDIHVIVLCAAGEEPDFSADDGAQGVESDGEDYA